jgi:hypothetical protein
MGIDNERNETFDSRRPRKYSGNIFVSILSSGISNLHKQ